MASAANQQAYGNPAWGNPGQGGQQTWDNQNQGWSYQGWGYQGWGGPPFWHPWGFSRGMAIAATILGFILWWPIGLAILISMIWSGRMGCWGRRARAEFRNAGWQGSPPPWAQWRAWCTGSGGERPAQTSGNRAFDEYRSETLRRLEEEQKEFGAFLDRLRFAKDKAEFDAFMAERRQRPTPPAPSEEPAPG
ncbi:MAG TPA: DUF2852 domain-containing protein [Acetobacteraceae bacterium]|nr:DUF2852 domain-containing protein [Acetobacteraceae bacterium]